MKTCRAAFDAPPLCRCEGRRPTTQGKVLNLASLISTSLPPNAKRCLFFSISCSWSKVLRRNISICLPQCTGWVQMPHRGLALRGIGLGGASASGSWINYDAFSRRLLRLDRASTHDIGFTNIYEVGWYFLKYLNQWRQMIKVQQ